MGLAWLTSDKCSIHSLASILNCFEVSELPTSKRMLGLREKLGLIPLSASFFLGPSWWAGRDKRYVNPTQIICLLKHTCPSDRRAPWTQWWTNTSRDQSWKRSTDEQAPLSNCLCMHATLHKSDNEVEFFVVSNPEKRMWGRNFGYFATECWANLIAFRRSSLLSKE